MGKGTTTISAAVLVLSACGLQTGRPSETPADVPQQASAVVVEAPGSNPHERDDESAPLVKATIHGKAPNQIVVPSVYGYPLYAEGAALQGLRLLRQDNWNGYDRQEQTQPDGVVRVIESFPALGCTFDGIEEEEGRYVPLAILCDLPVPRERGSNRPVAGSVQVGAKADTVPSDPALAKAFFGEWHATSAGFSGNDGVGYFDTPSGLLGFVFVDGRLAQLSYTFDAAEQRWRTPDLWKAPLAYEVGR
ncbi:MAG TPA: hypothetical protein VK509_15485 [Polyangiales bacterium]|nr:hypothetical protein [Polyangiales bacterium]